MRSLRSSTLRLISAGAVLASSALARADDIDWRKVDAALGRTPAVADDVHRYAFPRTDLAITLDGVAIKPALALGGWIAFKPVGDKAMAMGDLVLLESEIGPVTAKLLEGGVEITALHNHLLRATPAVFYAHVEGHGEAAALAESIHDALAASETPLTALPAPAPAPKIDLEAAKLDHILGAKGKAVGGVYQFAIPRREQIAENGVPLSPAAPLGVAIAINFQPTGGGKAAVTGDFTLTANEVTPVTQELRANGVEVTALHSHMLNEQPRLFFLHFWANDDAAKLAKALHAALGKTATNVTGGAP